jgi:hypothetical protein
VIVVTGMHRSGTSMVCQLLRALGLDFGPSGEMYQADEWNAAGYLEARDVLDLNSRLVSGHPRTQGAVRTFLSQVCYVTMPGPGRIARRARQLRAEIDALGARHESHAVKDPRFCLTLPHWDAVRRIENVVVCVRHPAAVARSLKRRQRYPTGLGLRFWAYHVESLLEHVDSERTVFVDFDRLRGPDREEELAVVARGLGWRHTGDELLEGYASVFRSDLVHFEQPSDADLPEQVRPLWSRLQSAARQRRDALLG